MQSSKLKTEKSDRLFELSQKCIPGGVNSPVRACRAVGRNPVFIERAKGSRIWDADGNEYIDYVGSWGPMILGHAREEVIEAVVKAAELGTSFGAPTEKELILTELISDAMPVVEKLRLVNSGTEAVMSAVRLARGYTGRNLILKFRGCYHGHSDGLLIKAGSAALTTAVPDSLGVPEDYAKNTLTAEYNDTSGAEDIFGEYGERIAAVIVEPVAANMGVIPPEEGFLSGLRKLCDRYKSLLIFDEVITGFRLGYGGACGFYKIRPDLITLGKIIGGGLPLAAYGGRKDIMDMLSPLGGVYQAGTLSGNPLAAAAGIAALRILRKEADSIYSRLEEYASMLENAFYMRAKLDGGKACVNRAGSILCRFCTDEDVKSYEGALSSDTGVYASEYTRLLESGIYTAPSQFEAVFISAAHSREDIEETCEKIIGR